MRSPKGGLDWGDYAQKRHEAQMLEWLEFAWSNKNNHDYKTPQTERLGFGGVGRRSQLKTNRPYGTKMSKTINTYALYVAWKLQSDEVKSSYLERCYLMYNEAVPEMHLLFDYMEDRRKWK